MSQSSSSSSIGFFSLLGLLFIGLKLGGVVDWSWWYVTMSLWDIIAFMLFFILVGSIVVMTTALLNHLFKK